MAVKFMSLLTTVRRNEKLFGQSGIAIDDVKKFLFIKLTKMDEAIIQRFYKLYDRPVPGYYAYEYS
jgi:3-oxoacyl-[acyl-carrier-protein] synthase-3